MTEEKSGNDGRKSSNGRRLGLDDGDYEGVAAGVTGYERE